MLSVSAHEKGKTLISYAIANRSLVTTGKDMFVKCWNEVSGTSGLKYCIPMASRCLTYGNGRVFVSVSNRVESISSDNQKNVVYQFDSLVNYLFVGFSGKYLVGCSDDDSVLLLNITDGSRDLLLGHKGPVLSVTIDSEDAYIASAGCDGTVRIWDAIEKQEIQSFSLLEQTKSASIAANACRLKFGPTRKCGLAVPLVGKVNLYSLDSWSVWATLDYSNVTEKCVSECGFNATGDYFGCATDDGWVIIWDVDNPCVMKRWKNPRNVPLTGFVWHPKNANILYFADESGYFESIDINSTDSLINNDNHENGDVDDVNLEDFLDDMAEEDGGEKDDESVEKETSSIADFIDDRNVDIDKSESEKSVHENDDHSDIDDDRLSQDHSDNEIDISKIKAEFEPPEESKHEIREVIRTKIINQKREPHRPIHSGSSPRIDDCQLLFWNSVGGAKNFFQGDRYSDGHLHVFFNDASTYKPITIRHIPMEYQMGDVSPLALLLVSSNQLSDNDEEENESYGCVIRVLPLNANWHEWDRRLPIGEVPICCCLAGDVYVVVMTNMGFLRYFGIDAGGIQMYVEKIQGHPVALVGNHHDNSKEAGPTKIAVVIDDGSKLIFRLEYLRGGHFMYHGDVRGSVASDWYPMPISDGDRLVWIGFSDVDTLYAIDSRQNAFRLQISENFSKQPRWMPVANLQSEECKRNGNSYFPVGFRETGDKAGVQVIQCGGGLKYPLTDRMPFFNIIPFRVPLCLPVDDMQNYENDLLLMETMADWRNEDDDDIDDLLQEERMVLLKMFAYAITKNNDSVALGIARLMPAGECMEGARRIAMKKSKRLLTQKLTELALEKEREEEENKEDEDDGEENADKENEEDEEDEGDNTEVDHIDQHALESLLEDNRQESHNYSVNTGSGSATNPFRMKDAAAVTPSRKGLKTIDKLLVSGTNTPQSKLSEKNPMEFGNFDPKTPSLKIDRKRRKSIKSQVGTINKLLKK